MNTKLFINNVISNSHSNEVHFNNSVRMNEFFHKTFHPVPTKVW